MLQKYKKNYLDIAVLAVLFLFRLAYFQLCLQSCYTVDTHEYLTVDGFQWLHGTLDSFRLPFYPFLIDLCDVLFGGYQMTMLFLIQLGASLLSVLGVYFIMRKLSGRPLIYLTTTVLYGISATVLDWDKTVLTESLSLSLTVFVIFGLVYYIKENKLRFLAVAVAAAGIGAFTRAVFAIYAGLIFGFLILKLIFPGKGSQQQRKDSRIRDAKGLAMAMVPVVLLLGYGVAFQNQYGSFTLSNSSLGQQLAIVLQEGYYEDASDEELKAVAAEFLSARQPQEYQKYVDEMISEVYGDRLTEEEAKTVSDDVLQYLTEGEVIEEAYIEELSQYFYELYGIEIIGSFPSFYLARCYIMNHFKRDRIEKFIDEAKSANQLKYFRFMVSGSCSSLTSAYKTVKGGRLSYYLRLIPYVASENTGFMVIHGLMAGIVELVLFVIILLKRKYAHWIHLGFSAFILATAMLSLLGTNGEFGRTAVTMYPVMFVSIALWFSALFDHPKLVSRRDCR